jgi:ABC-type glycerol-3-phosphate transport system substrate-binding protein
MKPVTWDEIEKYLEKNKEIDKRKEGRADEDEEEEEEEEEDDVWNKRLASKVYLEINSKELRNAITDLKIYCIK